MKLLYINKIDTNVGWGLETFINRSLIELGVETICVDYQKNAYKLAQSLLDITEDFDAVLLQRGCGYLIPLEIIKAIDRPKFFIFTELIARNPNQHYLVESSIFDRVFLRSLPCIESAVSRGWHDREHLSLFLSAIDPDFHKPLDRSPKDIDILFIGNLLPRRQKIIAELAQHFKITTHNVFGQDMVESIDRAKIILNIHGTDFLDTETRVYETLACKGFLLTETLSTESPFQSGIDLVESANIEELTANIVYYLEHPVEREKIAASGYQKVVDCHTFTERAKQIEISVKDRLLGEKRTDDPFDRAKLKSWIKWENYAKVRDNAFLQGRRLLSSVKQKLINR